MITTVVLAGGEASGATKDSSKPTLLERQFPWERLVSTSQESAVGEIFGVPVSQNNYDFAKTVAWMFPQPWGAADLPEEQREAAVWDSLIFHYESVRQGIAASDDEVERLANTLLKNEKQPFTRRGDPAAYRRWVTESAREPVAVFENQLRFLLQIRALKDQVRAEQVVTVTDAEMREEFLNEQHHVGGEMVTFDMKPEAEAFYEQVNTPAAWEAMKATGERTVRPVSLMTLEAYMDLWGISTEAIYAFHALPLGAIGPPMPFGRQWCVYRLLDKRTGALTDFPAQREAYLQQVTQKKQYEGLTRWMETLKASASRRVSGP